MPDIHETIKYLEGTTNAINLDDFTIEQLEVLDSEIFECNMCGWWCPIEEECGDSTENICQECKE